MCSNISISDKYLGRINPPNLSQISSLKLNFPFRGEFWQVSNMFQWEEDKMDLNVLSGTSETEDIWSLSLIFSCCRGEYFNCSSTSNIVRFSLSNAFWWIFQGQSKKSQLTPFFFSLLLSIFASLSVSPLLQYLLPSHFLLKFLTPSVFVNQSVSGVKPQRCLLWSHIICIHSASICSPSHW